jgi:hypothetical protein
MSIIAERCWTLLLTEPRGAEITAAGRLDWLAMVLSVLTVCFRLSFWFLRMERISWNSLDRAWTEGSSLICCARAIAGRVNRINTSKGVIPRPPEQMLQVPMLLWSGPSHGFVFWGRARIPGQARRPLPLPRPRRDSTTGWNEVKVGNSIENEVNYDLQCFTPPMGEVYTCMT